MASRFISSIGCGQGLELGLDVFDASGKGGDLFAQGSQAGLEGLGETTVVVLNDLPGFGQHVLANYDAAPLDFRYTDVWDKLPAYEQWWLAFSETVGPAPPMAPGVLAQAAFALGLATLAHPALRRPQ